jgi:hypothetical protein
VVYLHPLDVHRCPHIMEPGPLGSTLPHAPSCRSTSPSESSIEQSCYLLANAEKY